VSDHRHPLVITRCKNRETAHPSAAHAALDSKADAQLRGSSHGDKIAAPLAGLNRSNRYRGFTPALERRCDMHATTRRYEGVTDPVEAGRRVSEGFVPLISKMPGFVAYYWADAGGGVMVSTSVFQDRAGVEASNRQAADWVRENMAPLLPNPPQITAGEVVAHTAK
jgi:hypothetical protein